MTRTLLALLSLALASCAPPRPVGVDPSILSEVAPGERRQPPPPAAVNQALLPPVQMDMPDLRGQNLEPRFDLSVSNAPAAQVFGSIVSGTRYSMLVHSGVTGTISVNLKDVSVREALEAIRELYGYEYRIDGTRIFIQPVTIQTRIFNVNYLIGQRLGRSDLRVTSGSVGDAPVAGGAAAGTPGAPTGTPAAPGVPGAPGSGGALNDSSRIQTQTKSDFWDDLERTLKALVGSEPGRGVVVNPQAGVVVVRAMPAELRSVDLYLRAIRGSVERQVMLEAKIVEVTLNSQYQTGINWAAFSGAGLSAGPVSPGTLLDRRGSNTGTTLATGASGFSRDPGTSLVTISGAGLASDPGRNLFNDNIPGASLFGLAFQAKNFAALLTFLESQGNVQVLSSPRIAALNNQKAVLKVGTDQFFVTAISGSATATAATSTGAAVPAFPTITVRPFFSGVALDITPQIDEDMNIILHIHPSVSDVQTDNRQINLGGAFGGVVTLPLAKSNVSETDSVVKVSDGNIVAIGGLMKLDLEDSRSGLPGLQDTPVIGDLFRSTTRTIVKKELVILVKPTVVQSDKNWEPDLRETRNRLESLSIGSERRQ
jgi:MSHA biogenesis protein MshL